MSAQVGQACTLPSRILLATDLTDLKQILPVAIDYALKWKAALRLVHVLPGVNMPDTDPRLPVHANGETGRERAEKILEEAAKKGREAGAKCTWIVCSGQVAHTILRMVQEWRADRVVVGSHGFQKFHQELLGSVSEALLYEADVPVLAVGPAVEHNGRHLSKKSRILLATALDRESFAVAESVARLARIDQAELTMLHIIPEIAKAHPSALRVRAYAEHKFQEILSSVSTEAFLPSCMIERGPIVETILRVASQGHFDLILLGGVSGSSFRPNIAPGTAYGVICAAPCPVLVLKEEHYQKKTMLTAAS